MNKRVYVVILNWRGWRDTIACLETLFASTDISFRVIVCDNGSNDGSLDHIASWAKGEVRATLPGHPRLAALMGKIQRRPVYQRLDRTSAEAGSADAGADLLLIDNADNLGFAAGNNVGLRLALSQPDMDCVWLLNNDTLVEPDCLVQMRKTLAAVDDAAVCGAMIHFFDQPDVIQAIGGNRFRRLTGTASRSEGRFLKESELVCIRSAERAIDYLSGCSMLIPRRFLEQVGLMGEEYFLYYEEIDWFTRAAGAFSILIANGAHLYHREGSAIGSPGWQRAATPFSDYHLYRSRFIFMRKFYPQFLPVCYVTTALDVVKRLLKGQLTNAQAILTVLFGKRRRSLPA